MNKRLKKNIPLLFLLIFLTTLTLFYNNRNKVMFADPIDRLVSSCIKTIEKEKLKTIIEMEYISSDHVNEESILSDIKLRAEILINNKEKKQKIELIILSKIFDEIIKSFTLYKNENYIIIETHEDEHQLYYEEINEINDFIDFKEIVKLNKEDLLHNIITRNRVEIPVNNNKREFHIYTDVVEIKPKAFRIILNKIINRVNLLEKLSVYNIIEDNYINHITNNYDIAPQIYIDKNNIVRQVSIKMNNKNNNKNFIDIKLYLEEIKYNLIEVPQLEDAINIKNLSIKEILLNM